MGCHSEFTLTWEVWCAVCFNIILCQWGKEETILARYILAKIDIWAKSSGKFGSIFGLKIDLSDRLNIRAENRFDFLAKSAQYSG